MTYIHQLDPVIFTIYGDIAVRWYGTAYLAGFIVAYFFTKLLSDRGWTPLKVEQISDLVTYCAIGTMVGGRLGYVVFYNPELLFEFRSSLPFWGVLAVHEGGMASHGGMIGIAVACFLYARKTKMSVFPLFDVVTIAGCFGIIFGRIANFINGELLGRVVEGSHWLVVKFPTELRSLSLAKKAQLSEAVELVGVSREQWNDWIAQFASSQQARGAVAQTIEMLIQATQQGQMQVIQLLEPMLDARYPSQLYAAFFEGFAVFVALIVFWWKPRKPGVVGASYLIWYGLARIFTEQFRTPDAHLGFQLFGLTRGQWLSLAMFAIGVGLVYFWSQRKALPYGGWLKGTLKNPAKS